jgi:hypothetical protein
LTTGGRNRICHDCYPRCDRRAGRGLKSVSCSWENDISFLLPEPCPLPMRNCAPARPCTAEVWQGTRDETVRTIHHAASAQTIRWSDRNDRRRQRLSLSHAPVQACAVFSHDDAIAKRGHAAAQASAVVHLPNCRPADSPVRGLGCCPRVDSASVALVMRVAVRTDRRQSRHRF